MQSQQIPGVVLPEAERRLPEAERRTKHGAQVDGAPLSRGRRVAVGIAAAAFVGATVWQVLGQRDDWPLSCFEMYANLEGAVSSRAVVKGVSDQGEFDLTGEMMPFGGARLRHLNDKLARDRKRQRVFISMIQSRYEADREAKGWPLLQGVRSYSETWTIQDGLRGIDKPKRRSTGSIYLAPNELVTELDRERSGEGPMARPLPAGDMAYDFSADACGAGCERVDDRFAAGGSAVRLGANGVEGAAASVEVDLDRGGWALFVRMRTPADGGTDRLRINLDGKRLGGKLEIGNYDAALGRDAWVWASASPGDPPFRFELADPGRHTFGVRTTKGSVDVDEIWFSRAQKELPTWSGPVQP